MDAGTFYLEKLLLRQIQSAPGLYIFNTAWMAPNLLILFRYGKQKHRVQKLPVKLQTKQSSCRLLEWSKQNYIYICINTFIFRHYTGPSQRLRACVYVCTHVMCVACLHVCTHVMCVVCVHVCTHVMCVACVHVRVYTKCLQSNRQEERLLDFEGSREIHFKFSVQRENNNSSHIRSNQQSLH